MNSVDKMQIFTLAALLDQGKSIDYLSMGLSVAAMIASLLLCLTSTHYILLGLLLIVSVGLVEKYVALRVNFDAQLFHYLAKYPDNLCVGLQELDGALVNLNLIKMVQATRNFADRQQGALALLKKQLLCCGVQIVLFFMTILCAMI